MSDDLLFLVVVFLFLGTLMWLANVAEARRQTQRPYEGVALTAYVLLGVLYGLGFLIGLLFQLSATVLTTQPQLLEGIGDPGANPLEIFESFGLFSLGLWLPSLLGLVLLLPVVRRGLARLIPIDPANPVHTVALAFIPLVAMNLLITLGLGLENLTEQLRETADQTTPGMTFVSLWAQQLLTAALAIVGVGLLVRRDWPTILTRLGLVRPTGGQVLIGIGLALALVPLVLLVEYLSTLLGLGENTVVEELTEQLLGPLFRSPFGIFTLGVAAAIGEETLLRGAVQPRFGLLLTTILFALLHSNYGLSISTAIVFVLGLILGLVRMRYNTSTAMIVHAVYNATLGVLAYLSTGA
jgi:hypothetical protein